MSEEAIVPTAVVETSETEKNQKQHNEGLNELNHEMDRPREPAPFLDPPVLAPDQMEHINFNPNHLAQKNLLVPLEEEPMETDTAVGGTMEATAPNTADAATVDNKRGQRSSSATAPKTTGEQPTAPA